MSLNLVERDRLKNDRMECNGGSKMNLDTTDSNKAERLKKPYHTPELTTLGSIDSVVRTGTPNMGDDCEPTGFSGSS